jgi:hypothetical protein
MTDAMTLKPCPFCGGNTVCKADNEDKEWYANTWWVECCDCGAHGPEQFNGEDRSSFGAAKRSAAECKEAAIAAWNRRASLSRTEVQGVVAEGMVAVSRWRLERAASIIECDGDLKGIGLDIRDMLAAAPPPPAPSTDAREGEDLVTMPRWVAERIGRFYVPKEDSDAIFSRREAIRLYHAALASGGRGDE